MTEHAVVVDGVTLERPEALTPEEVKHLGCFNAERRAGYLYDAGTLQRMRQMQMRFDWLGYYTEDGQHHGGHLASPRVVIFRAKPQRWWQRKVSA